MSIAPNHEKTWSRILIPSLDVSARKRAEQALSTKLDLLAALAGFDKEVAGLGTLNCGARERDGIPENYRELLTLMAPRLAQSLAKTQLFDKLTESEELFRSVFENAAVGVAMADHRGQRVSASLPAA